MKIIYFITCFIISHFANMVYAEQAAVRSYDQAESEVGQAYLTKYHNQCIAILPEHVVNSTTVPGFLKEGNDKILGEARKIEHLGDDIAIAYLFGKISKHCGSNIATISRSVKGLLKEQAIGTIRTVRNNDGTIGNISVTIIDNDNKEYLYIKTTSDKDDIQQGKSGSMVMVNNKPIGMLLAVEELDEDAIFGKVIRIDVLLEKVETHMQQSHKKDTSEAMGKVEKKVDKRANLVASKNGAKITDWSSTPISSKFLINHLIDQNPKTVWRSKVVDWPTFIEIDLAGDNVSTIQNIQLSVDNIPVKERPNQIELLLSIDKNSWRSHDSYTLEYKNNIANLSFVPTTAKQIKIVIYSTQGKLDTVGISDISVQ